MEKQPFINLLKMQGYTLGDAIRIVDAIEKIAGIIAEITPVIVKNMAMLLADGEGRVTE